MCDLGREFQKEFENLAEADGTELLPSALEMPEQRGYVERQGQLYKEMFYKTMEQVTSRDWPTWYQTIDLVCFTKNRLLSRGGFSPGPRVFGYQQRNPDESDLAVQSLAAIGDTNVAKAMEIGKAASIAFHETDCQQAVRAAATHRPRPHYSHEMGKAVYFWRRGADAARKPATYFWHGPARVVATQLPYTVWLPYNHHLVKAAPPEKIRPASGAFSPSLNALMGFPMLRSNLRQIKSRARLTCPRTRVFHLHLLVNNIIGDKMEVPGSVCTFKSVENYSNLTMQIQVFHFSLNKPNPGENQR